MSGIDRVKNRVCTEATNERADKAVIPDKIVVITGGTSGIGLATVRKFIAEYGTKVKIISISRNKDKVSKLLAEDSALNVVDFYQANVAKVNELHEVCQYITKTYGRIDVLINNAGMIIAGGLEKLSFDDWRTSIENNLSSFFYVTKVFLPLLKQGRNANIVNLSSISSKLSGASMAYSVAKAGVDMVTACLARELAKYNIRVNSVNPGITKSGFQVHNGLMDEQAYIDFMENIEKDYLLGLGCCEEVAELIYYLSSEKARWITGSSYIIDGGRSINI